MLILVINSGSSSLKYRLYDMTDESLKARGLIERIGLESGIFHHIADGKEHEVEQAIPDHGVAFGLLVRALLHPDHGVIKDLNAIQAVGHRVVHGGERFTDSAIVTEEVIDAIKAHFEMAPLHNPPNLLGIQACMEKMPGIPNVAVFDTSFHAAMPKYSYLYAIPYEYYEKFAVRRYGFHGLSHKYVVMRVAELMNKPLESLKIVTCHLGNGSSLSAVTGGRSIDTSLGFGTVCGVPMGTRSGDVDPSIITFLQRKLDMSPDKIDDLLFRNSGLKGLTGCSDMRDVEDRAEAGDEMAKLAMEMLAYRIRKYIGAYAAAIGGLDAVVFTAGIGENDPLLREMVLRDLEFLGIKLDLEKNRKTLKSPDTDITLPGSPVKVFVIPTNEELMIARDARRLVEG
jgi:acetate kinase